MKTKILITGATGTTGQYTIENLLKKGNNVRAMVKTIDKRSDYLEKMGAEIVQGNFSDLNSLRIALKDIKRAYLCYPFIDGLLKGASYFAKAAKENGVELTVAMSQMNVHENASSPATQNHSITEDILDWANIGAVHIRPGLFASNYRNMAGITIKAECKFYFPDIKASYTIIHPKDISDVVAEILTTDNPQQYIGNSYLLTGPRTYNNKEVVDEMATILNKKVEYVPITVQDWVEFMKNDPYVNDFLAKHLQELVKDIANGKMDIKTNIVKEITANEPRSFSDYISQNIDAFKS